MDITPELGAAYASIVDTAEAFGDADFTLDDAGIETDLRGLLRETGLVVTDGRTVVDWADDVAPRRARQHPDHAAISVLVPNPKRGKSAERFALYASSPTVADYIAACVALGYPSKKALADLKWDEAHGYIAVTT